MRLWSVIAALACLAAPVRADLAADYAAIFEVLDLDLSRSPDEQFVAAEARIRALAGRWVPLSVMAGERTDPPPADIIARACDRVTMDIVPMGALGMTVSTGNAKMRTTAHLQFAGGVDFVGVIDEESTLARLFPDPEPRTPQRSFTALTTASLLGRVVLLPAGKNLLILIAKRRPPEIWGRCGG